MPTVRQRGGRLGKLLVTLDTAFNVSNWIGFALQFSRSVRLMTINTAQF